MLQVHDDRKAGRTERAAHVAEQGTLDYVWFTPRATDEDPCAAFRSQRQVTKVAGARLLAVGGAGVHELPAAAAHANRAVGR